MKKIFLFFVSVFISVLSFTATGQKLSPKFPAQIKSLIEAVKTDIKKLKGEPVSGGGEYKSKLPLEGFEVYYNEPEYEDVYVSAGRSVEPEQVDNWMNEIATSLKKFSGYTVKDSDKDKDYFTGDRETVYHKIFLLKGDKIILMVNEAPGFSYADMKLEILFF